MKANYLKFYLKILKILLFQISEFLGYFRKSTWGSSGSGLSNRAWIDKRTVRKVIAAAHFEAKISRQIAPVTLDTLGCHKGVVNRTFGGVNGYVEGISKEKIKNSPGKSSFKY